MRLHTPRSTFQQDGLNELSIGAFRLTPGKTTTSALVQQLIPNSRVFDAEKVGETLMDVTPRLPLTDNFQHWSPWRPLVVETARHILDLTGGTLVMPMTVLGRAVLARNQHGPRGSCHPVTALRPAR